MIEPNVLNSSTFHAFYPNSSLLCLLFSPPASLLDWRVRCTDGVYFSTWKIVLSFILYLPGSGCNQFLHHWFSLPLQQLDSWSEGPQSPNYYPHLSLSPSSSSSSPSSSLLSSILFPFSLWRHPICYRQIQQEQLAPLKHTPRPSRTGTIYPLIYWPISQSNCLVSQPLHNRVFVS